MTSDENDRVRASLGLTRLAGAEGWTLDAPPGAVVFERGDDRLVVIEIDMSVRWALLEWTGDMGDGSHAEYDIEAHGYGYSGALREARHTYFGDEGYVFYVDPLRLAWAFDCLRRWFDFPGLPDEQA